MPMILSVYTLGCGETYQDVEKIFIKRQTLSLSDQEELRSKLVISVFLQEIEYPPKNLYD